MALYIRAAAAMFAAVAAPVVIQHSGTLRGTSPTQLSEVLPPARYQGDAAAIAIFTVQAPAICPGGRALACTAATKSGVPILIIPNPCGLAGKELYATVLCHELGHVNGWPAEHGP